MNQVKPLSPILFNYALEEIFKNSDWQEKGIKIERKYLRNLRSVEDV